MPATDDHPTVEVFIDDMPVTDFTEVWFHYQDDPHPGGHHYLMRLHGSGVRRELGDIAPGRQRLNRSMTEYAFWWIESLLRKAQPLERSRGQFRYVINTIDEVDTQDDEMEVRGICSPFVVRRAS